MDSNRWGHYSPDVDLDAEEARRDLLAAIAAAHPRSSSQPLQPTGDARQEVLAALQRRFPRSSDADLGDSQIPRCVEVEDSHNTDGIVEASVETNVDAPGTMPVVDVADSPEATTDTESQRAEDTDKVDRLQEGIDSLGYLSKKPLEAKCAWIVQKAEQLRREGNTLFGQGELGWRAASVKYRSVLDLLGDRESFPEVAKKTHDDLVVLCASNLAACALKAEDHHEVIRLSEKVLTIDPQHLKARFRKALALIRQGRLPHAGSHSAPEVEYDDANPRWAASRTPSSSSATPVVSGERATVLLQVQIELESICQSNPKDRLVRDSVEELFAQAIEEKVRLTPPAWLMPKGLRDFAYLHSVPPNDASSSTGGRCTQGPDCPGRERNLLIFLHGFGGRKESFVKLAESLRLPRTAVLSLNAPHELPAELLDDPPGFSWFAMLDESFEFIIPAVHEKRRRKSLDKTNSLLDNLLQTLVSMCGWDASEIFLFGFGQGGIVALDALLRPGLGLSLGGVVGIATEVLLERRQKIRSKSVVPVVKELSPAVLLIHGRRDEQTSVESAEASAELLREVLGESNVVLRIFSDRGGEMLRGADVNETRLLMEFLSEHLHGVGKRGSEEAMKHLGAEEVSDFTLVQETDRFGAGHACDCALDNNGHAVQETDLLQELD